MHAGYPMAERMRALLFNYPQVYVDIGSIVYTEPRPAFYGFLRELVDAGYGDRIMFGSDQMIWPGVIEASIRTIEKASFLSAPQKRCIFYNNAARFLRLTNEQLAEHRRRLLNRAVTEWRAPIKAGHPVHRIRFLGPDVLLRSWVSTVGLEMLVGFYKQSKIRSLF